MENVLRAALVEIGSMKPVEARQRLEQLETEHGPRRKWVWARLGKCPLANALEHLAMLAKRTATTLGGDSADVMAKLYTEGAYLADDGGHAGGGLREDRRRHHGRPGSSAMRVPAVVGRHRKAFPELPVDEGPAHCSATGGRRRRGGRSASCSPTGCGSMSANDSWQWPASGT